MIRWGMRFVVILALILQSTGLLEAKPQRVVSLNLAADEILLQLLPKERIVGLSKLAADPQICPVADLAQGVHLIKGTAEEVIELKPDLVIVGKYSTPTTTLMLQRLGVKTYCLDIATDFDEVRKTIRALAAEVGEESRAAEIISEMDLRLADADRRRPAVPTIRVLSLTVGAETQPKKSILNAIMEKAGVVNLAASLDVSNAGYISLESILLHPPDVILEHPYRSDYPTLGNLFIHHPAFLALKPKPRRVEIPMSYILCGNNLSALAVGILQDRLFGTSSDLPPK